MRIVTKHTSNASGRSQVIAKGHGRQRTVSVDLSKSADWNHGIAAGTLALTFDAEWHDGISHVAKDDGSHVFIL